MSEPWADGVRSDVLSAFRDIPDSQGMCAYFIDRGTAALYSYLLVGVDGTVAEVREKQAVSEMANAGAYGFPSADILRTYIQSVRTRAKKAASARRPVSAPTTSTPNPRRPACPGART